MKDATRNVSWKVRGLAALVVLVLALLLLEGASFLLWRMTTDAKARLFVPHSDFGYFHRPGTRVEYEFRETAGVAASTHQLVINAKGLRDVERSYDKPGGVRRILVLGDSMVFAHQVLQEARFTDLLERRLRGSGGAERHEVIPAGVDGYGTANQLLFFRHEGVKYEPDVVILTFCMFNDVMDNHRPLARKTSYTYVIEPYFVREDGVLALKNHPARSTLLSQSYAYRQLAKTSGTWMPGLVEWANGNGFLEDYPLYGRFMDEGIPLHMRLYLDGEYDEAWREAWEITTALIAQLDEEVRRSSAKLLVLVVPSKLQLRRASYWKWTEQTFPALRDVPMDLERPSELLNGFLEANEIPFIDLLPRIREFEADGERSAFYDVDIHLREEGHELVADTLAGFLESRGWLGPGRTD